MDSQPRRGVWGRAWARRLLPLLLLAAAPPLAAQEPSDSAPAGDTTSQVIRAVELERRDIFDPDETGFVARVGNALHIETRARDDPA